MVIFRTDVEYFHQGFVVVDHILSFLSASLHFLQQFLLDKLGTKLNVCTLIVQILLFISLKLIDIKVIN